MRKLALCVQVEICGGGTSIHVPCICRPTVIILESPRRASLEMLFRNRSRVRTFVSRGERPGKYYVVHAPRGAPLMNVLSFAPGFFTPCGRARNDARRGAENKIFFLLECQSSS